MFCGNCGQENPAEAQFCTSCGTGLARQRTPFPMSRGEGATGAATLGGSAGAGAPSGPASGAPWRASGAGSGGDVGPRLDLSLGARATGGVLTPPGRRGGGSGLGGDVRSPIDLSLGSARTGGGPRPPSDDQAAIGLATGDVVADRYEIKALLGHGGMGAVYRVLDRVRAKEVALKVMLPSLMALEKAVDRFTHEAELSLALANEHIVRVFDVGEDRVRGLRFFTMELIQGMSLRDWVEEKRKLGVPVTPDDAMDLLEQLLDALAYAHKTTVHRDLKPENIMVTPRDKGVSMKVLDFGIAKLQSARQFTSTSMALGTAYYMAPEQQTDAASVDHRADLYSVGVVFYELLTGRLPVGRFKTPSEERAALPRGLDPLVLAALESDPARRPQSAAAFLEELRSVRKGQGGRAGAASTGGGKKVAVAAIVLVVLGGGGAAGWKFRDRLGLGKPSASSTSASASTEAGGTAGGGTVGGGAGSSVATSTSTSPGGLGAALGGTTGSSAAPARPPRVIAQAPAEGAILRGDVEVKGRIEGGVARVVVNTIPVKPAPDGTFTVRIAGAPEITIEGLDASGARVAQQKIRVTIDDERPKIRLLQPGRVVTAEEAIDVAGEVTDRNPEATILVGGTAYPLKDGKFTAHRTLTPGENRIAVQATDRAGNETRATAHVVYDREPPSVVVESPAPVTRQNRKTARVRGRLSDAETAPHALVGGRNVTPDRTGGFETDVPLEEGRNAIEVVAVDEAGNRSEAVSVEVIVDTKPPALTVDPPAATSLEGSVVVSGTLDEDGCDVTVDGLTAVVEGRRFKASFPAATSRTFVVVARDAARNESAPKLVPYAAPKPGGPVAGGPGSSTGATTGGTGRTGGSTGPTTAEPPPVTRPSGPVGTIDRIDATWGLLIVKLAPGAVVKTGDILEVLRGPTRVGKIRVKRVVDKTTFSANPDRSERTDPFLAGDQVEWPTE